MNRLFVAVASVVAVGVISGAALPALVVAGGIRPPEGMELAWYGFGTVFAVSLLFFAAIGATSLAMDRWFPDEPDLLDDISGWRWSPWGYGLHALIAKIQVAPRASLFATLCVASALAAGALTMQWLGSGG